MFMNLASQMGGIDPLLNSFFGFMRRAARPPRCQAAGRRPAVRRRRGGGRRTDSARSFRRDPHAREEHLESAAQALLRAQKRCAGAAVRSKALRRRC